MIFWARSRSMVSPWIVQRLALSKHPSLSANLPVTSTLVLRLSGLLEGTGYAPTAANAIQRLFHLPQVNFCSEEGKHQPRFNIDYLRRRSGLDSSEIPSVSPGASRRTSPAIERSPTLAPDSTTHPTYGYNEETTTQSTSSELLGALAIIISQTSRTSSIPSPAHIIPTI